MQLYVMLLTGKMIKLDVDNTDSIQNIKQQIFNKIGIYPEKQKIIFNNIVLDDNNIINYYHIKPDNTLNVIIS